MEVQFWLWASCCDVDEKYKYKYTFKYEYELQQSELWKYSNIIQCIFDVTWIGMKYKDGYNIIEYKK